MTRIQFSKFVYNTLAASVLLWLCDAGLTSSGQDRSMAYRQYLHFTFLPPKTDIARISPFQQSLPGSTASLIHFSHHSLQHATPIQKLRQHHVLRCPLSRPLGLPLLLLSSVASRLAGSIGATASLTSYSPTHKRVRTGGPLLPTYSKSLP